MTTFATFGASGKRHMREFEGDYMVQDGEFVQIFVNSTKPDAKDRMVASIRLEQGQCVKEVKERRNGTR